MRVSAKFLANAIKLVVSTVLMLGALEVAVRVLEPDSMMGTSPRFLYRHQPASGYALAYGFSSKDIDHPRESAHVVATRTNRYGFRSRDDVPRRNDVLRVMTLGDSMTFGFGVRDSETFSWRLDEILRRAVPGADVLNGGATGMSNLSEMAYFESEGIEYAPNHVVLQIYPGNDHDQNWDDRNGATQAFRYGIYQKNDPAGIVRMAHGGQFFYAVPSRLQRWDEALHGRVRLYRALSDRLLHLSAVVGSLEALGLLTKTPLTVAVNNVLQPTENQEKIAFTIAAVKAFNERLRARGISLTALVFPVTCHAPSDSDRSLGEQLQEAGVDVVGPDFFGDGDRLYHMRCGAPAGHLDPEEHQVVAAALFRHLQRKHLKLAEDRVEAALEQALTFHSAMTCAARLVVDGAAQDALAAKLPSYTPLAPSIVRSVTEMTAPTATTLADGKVDLAKFRRDVVDLAVQPPVYYVWAGDWGHGRLAIDVEFTRPVRLDAVEVVLGPFYPNYRASFVVLKGAADEPLAILSDPSPAGRARFVSAPLGTVTRLRAEIYRPEGTTTFSVKGFAFYGQ